MSNWHDVRDMDGLGREVADDKDVAVLGWMVRVGAVMASSRRPTRSIADSSEIRWASSRGPPASSPRQPGRSDEKLGREEASKYRAVVARATF